MGSIEKIYNELKQTKEQMNFHEQQIEQLNFRIEAIQRHHQIKMEQAMRTNQAFLNTFIALYQ